MLGLKDALVWTGLFDNTIMGLNHQIEQWTAKIKENKEIGDTWIGGINSTAESTKNLTKKIEEAQIKLQSMAFGFEVTHGEGLTTKEVFQQLIDVMEKWRNQLDSGTDATKKNIEAQKEWIEVNEGSVNIAEVIFAKERERIKKLEAIYANYYKHRQIQERQDLAISIKLKEQGNQQIFDNTKSSLSALSGLNKNAFKAFQAFSIAEAIINAYKGASNAMGTYTAPLSYIVAASSLAKGLALVAQIRSQTYSGKRMGGGVREGQPYMVGEAGRELFVPNQSGNIVANNQLGRSVNVNFHIETVDAGGFDQLLSQRRSLIVNMINSAVNEQGKQAIV
jgi:hypothetical protein